MISAGNFLIFCRQCWPLPLFCRKSLHFSFGNGFLSQFLNFYGPCNLLHGPYSGRMYIIIYDDPYFTKRPNRLFEPQGRQPSGAAAETSTALLLRPSRARLFQVIDGDRFWWLLTVMTLL